MQLSLEIWEIFSEMQLFHQIPLACKQYVNLVPFHIHLSNMMKIHILCSSVIMAYR
jgi:hypothetical protein